MLVATRANLIEYLIRYLLQYLIRYELNVLHTHTSLQNRYYYTQRSLLFHT